MSVQEAGHMPYDTSTTGTAMRQAPFIRVFGGMGVEGSDGPVNIGGPKQRRLLALLVIRSGSVVSLDWLSEYLWDDDERPEPTIPALRTYLSRLRRSLPAAAQEWVETESAGYRFAAPDEVMEHRRFAMLRAEANRARGLDDPQTAQRLLDEALGMWRGDPFRELEDLDWARADIEQLEIDRLEMMEERWEVVLALGRHTQITGELAAFTAEHGLRDRAARQYALALHRSGRTTEALRVIDEHRRTLAEQGGLEPSVEIVELEQALLSGDPSLTVEQTGRPLRGYRLIEQIGSGAFSVVWRGVQPSVNRDVAIKQIRSELASQPYFIRRFEAEAQLVARIEHPHIVPMIDFWRDPDSAYLVMRWLRGGTLERRLDDGPLTFDATMTLAGQIGGALSAAHARGVVHRDVKSANILFDEDGHGFLTDFGIALDLGDSGGPEADLSQGSPTYASPEQIRREQLGPRSDIFSLGVVIYECLAGSLPFRDSSSLEDLVDRQLHVPYPLLSEWRADLSAAIVDAVAKATSKDPSERFTTVSEFLVALESDAAVDRAAVAPLRLSDDLENPYKGLRAFDDGDADQFFGRERLTSELVDRLSGLDVASRCLVVVGPSGSGKSSVVRAGLLPALRAGAVDGSADWFNTVMVPGVDPFESLEAALLRIAVNPPPSLLGQLRDGNRGILRGVRRCLGSDNDTVLVVIDQFEELFIGESSDDANDFLDALAVAVEDPASPLRLAATLRADHYHRPLEHPAFAQLLNAAAVNVTPMAGDELEQAIVEPAARLGVGFEPGLVPRIAADTAGQPSPLPLLQYTLSELFDRRLGNQLTISAYDELGGLAGALATRAEKLYTEADDSQRQAVRRVFGRMTNPGEETADLRRRVPLADIGDDDATRWVLDRFGAARLVTFDRDVATREPTVEVAHEALLREWPRLVTWLHEDAEVLRSVDALARAATVWDQGGRTETDVYRGGRLENAIALSVAAPGRLRAVDNEYIAASQVRADAEQQTEYRRVHRLRRLVAGIGVALILALVAGGLALRQQQKANNEAQRAELAAADAQTQTARAEEQTAVALAEAERAELASTKAEEQRKQAEVSTLISRSAANSTDNSRISILLALEAHRRAPGLETEQAVLNALGSAAGVNRLPSIDLAILREDPCPALTINSAGLAAFVVLDGELVSQDLSTGELLTHGPSPADCVNWVGDQATNRRIAFDVDGDRLFLGPFDGSWEVEREFDEFTHEGLSSFRPSHRIVAVSETSDGAFPRRSVAMLLDDRTGKTVGTPVDPGGDFINAGANADGSLFAFTFGIVGRSEGAGLLYVLDGETGEELFQVDSTDPAVNLTWDFTAGQLVAGMEGGSVMTVDLVTGEIVSTVATTATSRFLDIGIRADGLVVAVSEGQIELVDRSTGPTGNVLMLDGVVDARIRPDGTVLTLIESFYTFERPRAEILDFDINGLVEQTFEVDAFSSFAFNAGLAGAIRLPAGTTEIVNLNTGDRSSPELNTPDKDRFDAIKIYPETDGLWALSPDNVIARWESERMVEQIDLGGTPWTSTRYLDRWAVASAQADGSPVVDLVNLERGATGIQFRVAAPDVSTAHPTRDGGVHVLDVDGTLHTYDADGQLVGEVETGWTDVNVITLDPASGRLAIAAGTGSVQSGAVLIVDPASGELEQLLGVELVGNLGFARNGELLVITHFDGTVRLWDLRRGESAGVLWKGAGATTGSPSWYDESTESIWVASSGKLLQIPLNPERWIERACESIGSNFTKDEWDRFVPGDELLWHYCV
jgi:serine/threonine protein kinase/DNA-binding SARP family transcriptional activator/WD40 repeat protein